LEHNTPGAPGNAATALDGYRLARAGKADLAIRLAVMASVVGGLSPSSSSWWQHPTSRPSRSP